MLLFFLILSSSCVMKNFSPTSKCLDVDNQILLTEFFKVSKNIGESFWTKWNDHPFSLLFIEDEREFLIKHPTVPKGFNYACKINHLGDIYSRKRVFDKNSLAAFQAFSEVPSIVIGSVKNTAIASSTEWLSLAFHEHFHQIQYSQPTYYDSVAQLNTRRDKGAKWMLNYPFPYQSVKANQIIDKMKDLLFNFKTYTSSDWESFYKKQLLNLNETVGSDNYNYFRFQVWQEGVAQYIEYRALKNLKNYEFSKPFKNLNTYESPKKLFEWKKKAFKMGLERELKTAKRNLIYNIGLYEILAKEYFKKDWENDYFKVPLTFDL